MTAQELMFMAWQKGYRLQPRNGKLRISHADRASIPPTLITEVRAHKPRLLALLGKLEEYGAADDGLILEALSLFNAEPKGLVKSSSMPLAASVRPAVASDGPRNVTASHWEEQRTFW